METQSHEGVEDEVPFQTDDFQVPHANCPGCVSPFGKLTPPKPDLKKLLAPPENVWIDIIPVTPMPIQLLNHADVSHPKRKFHQCLPWFISCDHGAAGRQIR